VSLRRAIFVACQTYLFLNLLFLPTWLRSEDVWDGPAFSASPDSLRQAASSIKAAKDMDVTVLLNEERLSFDVQGKEVDTRHMIYRIENEEGVKGWAETSGDWEPWRQAKPEIKVRVITSDGAVHVLDPKTLNDVPVHESDPDIYSDRRAYGGPLPAIAVGAIVEEEVTIRDTAPYFAGGAVERLVLSMGVPVARSRIILSHADGLPLHYVLHLLPDATVKKSSESGQETITIENGPLPPYAERLTHLPADVVPYPEVEFGTGTSWQRVAEDYTHLVNDKMRLADVQPLLAKLNVKNGSRMEVIRRMVAALHKSVRYTGVEFDESSLVPQFPSETLKRKYGDCKDKATLLAVMLRGAGIPASLALLDVGPGRDINVDLPGMGKFDHAIVYVPPSGSEPEVWIDATDEYARPGDLPAMDYGRWALVVDEKTTALTKIPELTGPHNFHRETREFTLAEFGPANIVEKNEQIGARESEFREFYNGDAKKVREDSEKYVKNEYLADSLTSLDHGDLADLEKPFSVTYVTKGKRGNTDYESAGIAIRVEDLFEGLPQYFTSADADEPEKDKDKDEKVPERSQPRTLDWQIDPFINEWDYKILAPPGYKLRALPPDKEAQLGTAKFTQKYSANAEGTVAEAVLRFESGKSRLTVAEAKVLREAVVQAQKADPVFITFDQAGHSLIAAGKIKDGLAAYHQLVQLHPKEALHRIQLARTLLNAGLAEEARSVAKEATVLEPASAQAYSTLAWILQHDLIGRRFKKGFDYDGAVAAYRKAKALDPKDKDVRTNLAILLESDSDGVRYSEKAHLREAIAEFKELRELDKDYMSAYEDNVLYDLWYAHDSKGLLETITRLPSTDGRKGLMLAAIAADQGPDAAIKKSLEITTEEQGRGKALVSAGSLLMRVRRYPETTEMFAAGSHGQPNESQFAASVAIFAKTKPYQQVKMDPTDPRSVMQRLFVLLLGARVNQDAVAPLFSKFVVAQSDFKDAVSFQHSMGQLRVQIGSTGLPLDVILDIALSNLRYTLEGDDNLGYKVTMEAPGAATQEAYVVHEDGQWKLAAFNSSSAAAIPEELSWQALACLQHKDLEHARKWLDWAREKIHISEGDDPLSGQPFPHFWTKGQEGDETAIRTASLVLLPSKELRGEYLSGLMGVRDAAKSDAERQRLNLVLAHAYAVQERWAELLDVAEKLLSSAPDSYVAFHFAEQAYTGLRRLEDWDKLVQSRLQKHSDDPEYVRSASRLADFQGQFDKARALLKTMIDRGKATQSDMNVYAWEALLTPAPPDQDAIDTARRANDLAKNSNFAILHTLACLYAETGKTAQARELLLKAMDAAEMESPDSEIWFGFAKIAEQYGESIAARLMYGRVEKPKTVYPGTSYAMAQQRLAVLKNAAATTAKSGGQ
jgi:tetratricopeptide (TPR) repeat protein/transglutaminase-like putative cysteine protease